MKKNDFLEKIKLKFSNLKNDKNKKLNKTFLFSICLIFVLIFVLISIMFKPKKKVEVETQKNDVSVSEYAHEIEIKLENIISKLDSISSVSVFVMIDSTPTIKYLTENKTETTTSKDNSTSTLSETVVFEKNGSVTTPVVVTTIMPKVTGVLIVTNEINPMTKLSIISSVSIVLNIDERCISLLQER